MDAHAHGPSEVIEDWAKRQPSSNDALLRTAFKRVLDESMCLPAEERLIMYDAVDETEVRSNLGQHFRRRIDARRNTKPKKNDNQLHVCTPFDESKFHFGKIRNERERLVKLNLSSAGRYDLLTNKFPLFPGHMLLVARAHVAQQITGEHLAAIGELLQATTEYCAYFNSWCASASVNHFHCHLIAEFPPVTTFPLVSGPKVAGVRCLLAEGFPGFCYVLPISAIYMLECIVKEMQADNQPHNLLFTPRHVYIFPKPHLRPSRSFDLYPETVGGPELIGSFTVYQQIDYDALNEESVNQLCRMNTAPLPSRLLRTGCSLNDDALHAAVAPQPLLGIAFARGLSMETLPSVAKIPRHAEPAYGLHSQSWPQDRPIARALASNVAIF